MLKCFGKVGSPFESGSPGLPMFGFSGFFGLVCEQMDLYAGASYCTPRAYNPTNSHSMIMPLPLALSVCEAEPVN